MGAGSWADKRGNLKGPGGDRLKAMDREARALQQKVEALTTSTAAHRLGDGAKTEADHHKAALAHVAAYRANLDAGKGLRARQHVEHAEQHFEKAGHTDPGTKANLATMRAEAGAHRGEGEASPRGGRSAHIAALWANKRAAEHARDGGDEAKAQLFDRQAKKHKWDARKAVGATNQRMREAGKDPKAERVHPDRAGGDGDQPRDDQGRFASK